MLSLETSTFPMNRWIVGENHITRAFGKFDLGVNRTKVRPVLCDQCYELETSENPAFSREKRTWHGSCTKRFARPDKNVSEPHSFQTAREISIISRRLA
jgi:hypothetical protein